MAGFADVLGHEQTIAHMKKAIELGKVSHAYNTPFRLDMLPQQVPE